MVFGSQLLIRSKANDATLSVRVPIEWRRSYIYNGVELHVRDAGNLWHMVNILLDTGRAAGHLNGDWSVTLFQV